MFTRLKFWITVNVYALLLDALSLFVFWIAYSLFRTGLVLGVLIVSVGVMLLYAAIGIHGTYPEKCRIYSVLLRVNKKQFKLESFRDFVGVPCHRVLVRMVLSKLDKAHEYPSIIKAYYRYPWQNEVQSDTKVYVFKGKDEGAAWLLQQKNRNG